MHKVGNCVVASKEEIFQMKTDARLFSRFVVLCGAWIAARSFTFARKTKADSSEWKTWLTSGLWKAVLIADDRLQGVGMVFSLAWRDAMKAYVATYENNAQKTEDACDSCNRDENGELEDIQIPSIDSNFGDMEFREFMDNLKTKISERDYLIALKRLDGYTLEEIGGMIGVSKQGVDKIFKKNILPKLRAYV
jgi:hypothetical protein